MPTKERFTALETCKASEEKPCPEPSKPICAKTKPRRRVKRVNWCLPGLYSVAHFLQSVSPKGFPYTILGKISKACGVRIIGTTLHVNVIRLREKDELNLILLATSLRVVNKVRIHNFQINFYLTTVGSTYASLRPTGELLGVFCLCELGPLGRE